MRRHHHTALAAFRDFLLIPVVAAVATLFVFFGTLIVLWKVFDI